MKGINVLLLYARQSPCFTTVTQSSVYTGALNVSLCVKCLTFSYPKALVVKQARVFEALPMRLFNLVSNDAFDAAFEPRYTMFFTFSISLPLILIDGKISVP